MWSWDPWGWILTICRPTWASPEQVRLAPGLLEACEGWFLETAASRAHPGRGRVTQGEGVIQFSAPVCLTDSMLCLGSVSPTSGSD